jgi:hypothetical protein
MAGPSTAIPCEMHDATSAALRTEQLNDQWAKVQALTTSMSKRKKKSASLYNTKRLDLVSTLL